MEKYPKTNKPIEQKEEADPKKINAAKAAFKWLKDNWKKSTILGVGAMMAAPSIAQNEADVNKQVGEEIANSEKNKNSYTIAGGHVLEKKQKKGEIKEDEVIKQLINTMEEYANYGFFYLLDKLDKDPNIFYKHTGFLDTILGLVQPDRNKDDSIEEL